MEALTKLRQVFAENGILSDVFPGFTPRQAQIELAEKILLSLADERHLMAEAGTGTGKSLAYLLASAIWALEEGKRVVISTNTIPLQSQLMDKELPVVAEVMRRLGYETFRYELVKGRNNYICKRRLGELILKAQQEEVPYAEHLAEISRVVDGLETGDRGDFQFPVPLELWQEINGDPDDCHGKDSPFHHTCFIQNARKKLDEAHLIVANHAMFFTDLSLRSHVPVGILPAYDRVIFDEAHRIEEVFSRFYERRLSLPQIRRLFQSVKTRRYSWMDAVFDDEAVQEMTRFETDMIRAYQPLFDNLALSLNKQYLRESSDEQNRVVLIEQPYEISQDITTPVLQVGAYLEGLAELRCSDDVEKQGMNRLIDRFLSIKEDALFILGAMGGEDWAHWLEMSERKGVLGLTPGEMLTLKAQPIHPRTLLPKALFEQVPVVMLSATLTTNRSFDFIAERLGLIDYEEVIISSPFDYRNRVLLVLSETAPDPGKAPKAYERFLIQGLERVLRLTGGRTLVLFTSYRLMGLVAEGLKEWLKQSDIQLLIQEEGNREWMIQQFKENPRSVMFGCDTFWEGIDIPGDALSCVVITKLPFANPQEPVVKAKVHSIDRSGGNSFTGFMVPSAMIKLKQGFGRLIRQEGDRGVVVVMDSRVIRMRYGQRFIDNLPPARKGYLKEIADYVPKK